MTTTFEIIEIAFFSWIRRKPTISIIKIVEIIEMTPVSIISIISKVGGPE